MKKAVLPMLILAMSMAACASMRGVQVGSDPVKTYAIEVTNNRAGTVTISYSAGGTAAELGTVAPRMTERFVIPLAQPGSITVLAKTSAGASAGNYPVTLQAGVTQRITVR
jgi:hypothetical protein